MADGSTKREPRYPVYNKETDGNVFDWILRVSKEIRQGKHQQPKSHNKGAGSGS